MTAASPVRSQHQMLLDGLHVDHLRLILGTSMGCMRSFVWGETYPDFADALMPLACLPVPIAGRNRMMRYMAIKASEDDPEWHGGDYIAEKYAPKPVRGKFVVIPASDATRGHGTHTQAAVWRDSLVELLKESVLPDGPTARGAVTS